MILLKDTTIFVIIILIMTMRQDEDDGDEARRKQKLTACRLALPPHELTQARTTQMILRAMSPAFCQPQNQVFSRDLNTQKPEA